MRKASRAIIIHQGKVLVMHRRKNNIEYFTLVGGRVADGETLEQAVVREVKEETGLDVTHARLVFIETHPEPYNEQYTFLCEIASFTGVALDEASEEAQLNKLQVNIHQPQWADAKTFASLHFRTPLLQAAIVDGLKSGFPAEPVELHEKPKRPKGLKRLFAGLSRSKQ